MNYLLLIWAEGMPSPDELATLQRDIPGWVDEMDGRGLRLFGRELDLPETAVTVREREGRTLVSDGPFAETKEFVAGFDLLDCADLNEAVEVAARCPISAIQSTEVRPFVGPLQLGERAAAFGRGDDAAGKPYALLSWIDPAVAEVPSDLREADAWRGRHRAGPYVLGDALGGPHTARTVRVRDGETLVSDRPRSSGADYLGAVDVVSCADRGAAVELAAGHPLARSHAIEVRPFYVG